MPGPRYHQSRHAFSSVGKSFRTEQSRKRALYLHFKPSRLRAWPHCDRLDHFADSLVIFPIAFCHSGFDAPLQIGHHRLVVFQRARVQRHNGLCLVLTEGGLDLLSLRIKLARPWPEDGRVKRALAHAINDTGNLAPHLTKPALRAGPLCTILHGKAAPLLMIDSHKVGDPLSVTVGRIPWGIVIDE